MGKFLLSHPSFKSLRWGAMFILVAAFLFSGMGAAVKIAAQTLPTQMIVFFRNAIGVMVLIPLILSTGVGNIKTRIFPIHLLRALSGLAAMYCFFYVIAHMSLAEAVLLNYTMPLFMPFIAHFWLREPVSNRIWLPLLVGFGGVLLILRPGSGLFEPVALYGVAAGILAAVAQVSVRRMTQSEHTLTIVFYFSFISSIISFFPAATVWEAPGRQAWLALIMIGVLASVAQLFLTRAFFHAHAAQVGPFVYASVLFAGFFDWWIWDALPDGLFIVGAVLVMLAGALTIRFFDRSVARENLSSEGKE